MDDHLRSQGFDRSINEPTLYVKRLNGFVVLIVVLYVDDLLIISLNNEFLGEFKNQMKKEFELIDLGQMTYFLGMEFIKLLAKDFSMPKIY